MDLMILMAKKCKVLILFFQIKSHIHYSLFIIYRLLISGSYDIYKNSVDQHFPVKEYSGKSFNYVTLKILNNHGFSDYTCLYRFQVH